MASNENLVEDLSQIKKEIQTHFAVSDKVSKCSTFAGMKIVDFFDIDEIKVGLRVVRGTDWCQGNEDGGNGNVGNVVKIFDDSKQVRVQWDSQTTLDDKKNVDIFNYRTGKGNKYDLLIFDNAQTGVHHRYYSCDSCSMSPIRGMRWRCLDCVDYNLCTDCYMRDIHYLDHAFERYQGNKSIGVSVGVRADASYLKARGIFKHEQVTHREDRKVAGTVVDIEDDIVKLYNCDAMVSWEGEEPLRYRVGREGKVDIKFTKPAEKKYFEDHLQEINKANAVVGIRVVKRSHEDHVTVGTITSIKEIKSEKSDSKERDQPTSTQRESLNLHQIPKSQTNENSVQNMHCLLTVQWDHGRKDEDVETSPRDILLFDNSQIGIEHDAKCNECYSKIKGMRWNCSKCPNYDLCTPCYMSAKDHHAGHQFYRFTKPRKSIIKLRTSREEVKVKTARGIFDGAEVRELDSSAGEDGKVTEICHYRRDNARCIVVVNDGKDRLRRGQLTDFKSHNDQKSFFYYPSHLPAYGKDIQGHVKVKDETNNTTITVELLYRTAVPRSSSEVKHSLYLIFAHKPEDNAEEPSGKDETLKDVKKFASKSRLPSQVTVEKVMFLDEEVVIHKDTTNVTIQKLIAMGVRKFIRGDTEAEEDEQNYFLRISQYLSGRVPLPTFISLSKGVTHTDALHIAGKNRIPVICFKQKAKDVNILTMQSYQEFYLAKEHKIELKNPWKVIKTCWKACDVGYYETDDVEPEISTLSDMPNEFDDMAALICNFLIGVFKNSDEEDIFGENSHIYPIALSMYLLRTGQWKIPKTVIEKMFNQRSIEFIFEEKITDDFNKGFWKVLELKTKSAYLVPKWKGEEKDIHEVADEAGGKTEDSDILGLMFFALLRKGYYDGAKQLIEIGGVRIPHLLIGCVILQETADNWKTRLLQKDKALQMKTMCTQQALRITSGIHETDTKGNTRTTDVTISGQRIDHAGRLLLNHGYLSDAIKTENSAYLNDEIVKKVISQMWYKQESVSFKQGLLFFILTLFHPLLLPILMFNRTIEPLKWLYKQYRIPVMKVLLNSVGLVMFLTAFTYMLLCDFSDGIARVDWFIIAWLASYFLDETKQILISHRREKITDYFSDGWNRLDWLIMLVYLCGMLVRVGSDEAYSNASKVLLISTFILMCVRFLNLLMISEIIGAKLVMIKKMFMDTFAFLSIMMLICVCYSISYYTLLYSGNSDVGVDLFEKVFKHGFWIMFGELSMEDTLRHEPDCSYNKEIYTKYDVPRCPSELGRTTATYLKGVYAVLTLILLLNLLIAIYSHTVAEVHEKSRFYWTLLQTGFLEDYSLKSIFPTHFQLFCLVPFFFYCIKYLCIKHLCFGFTKSKRNYNSDHEDNLNQGPEFIRVFLYDTNFDLKLKATREAEEQAALKASGVVEVASEDKLTVLRRKMTNINERTSKILTAITTMKGGLKSSNKGGFRTLRKMDSLEDTSSRDSENYDSD